MIASTCKWRDWLMNDEILIESVCSSRIFFSKGIFFFLFWCNYLVICLDCTTFYDELSLYQAADNHMPHVYQINFALCHLNLSTQFSAKFGV